MKTKFDRRGIISLTTPLPPLKAASNTSQIEDDITSFNKAAKANRYGQTRIFMHQLYNFFLLLYGLRCSVSPRFPVILRTLCPPRSLPWADVMCAECFKYFAYEIKHQNESFQNFFAVDIDKTSTNLHIIILPDKN